MKLFTPPTTWRRSLVRVFVELVLWHERKASCDSMQNRSRSETRHNWSITLSTHYNAPPLSAIDQCTREASSKSNNDDERMIKGIRKNGTQKHHPHTSSSTSLLPRAFTWSCCQRPLTLHLLFSRYSPVLQTRNFYHASSSFIYSSLFPRPPSSTQLRLVSRHGCTSTRISGPHQPPLKAPHASTFWPEDPLRAPLLPPCYKRGWWLHRWDPPELKAFSSQFADLPQGEIAKIFSSKFRPMNLYKLRDMKGKDGDHIQIEHGSLKVQKAADDYKDYGSDPSLWSEAFLEYSAILFSLFGTTSPALYLALANFHREIIDLAQVYKWQGGVLPLAIDLHTRIVPAARCHSQYQCVWSQGNFVGLSIVCPPVEAIKAHCPPPRLQDFALPGYEDHPTSL